jgi:hypothetical protein
VYKVFHSSEKYVGYRALEKKGLRKNWIDETEELLVAQYKEALGKVL